MRIRGHICRILNVRMTLAFEIVGFRDIKKSVYKESTEEPTEMFEMYVSHKIVETFLLWICPNRSA